MPRSDQRYQDQGSRRSAPDRSRVAKVDKVAEPVPLEGPVRIERYVAGGIGLGHDTDGRVVLVDEALPGDLVEVDVIEAKKGLIRGRIRSVFEEGPDRIAPPCPEVERGCGGCDLQHADPVAQIELKKGVVVDALRRIARIEGIAVEVVDQLQPLGYRTTLRCGVDQRTGRAGFRLARSHDVHAVDECLIAHPLARKIIVEGRFVGAKEVTVRVGVGSGDRLAVVSGAATHIEVPAGVVVVDGDDPARVASAHYSEIVCDHRFRISAGSFFQARPDGAESLVRAVGRALDGFDPASDRLVDLYGGVGLFTGGLGARRAELVEVSPSATADARLNLAEFGTKVIRSTVEKWRPSSADAVVADPARSGLGRSGVAAITGTGAARVALVSCDPAAMARDVRLLVDAGYALRRVEMVDMFPQTHHVETVASLTRTVP